MMGSTQTLEPIRSVPLRIFVLFKFNHENAPAAVTGVDGDIIDVLLPSVGDVVRHRDTQGSSFQGKVTNRICEYDLQQGLAVDGTIAVTLCLDRIAVQ